GLQSGVKGEGVDRDISQITQPAKVVAGLNAIIHENATAEDAYSLYMAK
ncbi:phospho-2-dehydro-3-deoxyheptonate aldolase, partial [Escherichia coli]|nr:phospho-2-dehydro-3-deoxyheptonate aldolase [Escherichia coli]